jgi:hypothetical protein
MPPNQHLERRFIALAGKPFQQLRIAQSAVGALHNDAAEMTQNGEEPALHERLLNLLAVSRSLPGNEHKTASTGYKISGAPRADSFVISTKTILCVYDEQSSSPQLNRRTAQSQANASLSHRHRPWHNE